MRTLATLLLVGLLASCPLLCAAAAAGHGPQCDKDADGPAGTPPVSCPGDGVCCICAGAIRTDGVRVPGLDTLTFHLPFDVAYLAPIQPPLHALGHLSFDGTPTGLVGWGEFAQVRALLQNFRC